MSRGAEMALEMITLFTPLRTFAGNGFIVVQLEFQVSHLVAWDRQPQGMTEIRARMLRVVSLGDQNQGKSLLNNSESFCGVHLFRKLNVHM